MKSKILWVEDDARTSLARLTGPVYIRSKYDLDIAHDVTTAIAYISEKIYNVIIVDIRIPSGNHPMWKKCYINGGGDKIRARLGLQLICSLLSHEEAVVPLSKQPDWIKPDLIFVFTVESAGEIENDLKRYGIPKQNYQQKHANLPDSILVTMIEQVLSKS